MTYTDDLLQRVLQERLSVLAQPKRKVFISYHHGSDQVYADKFKELFSQSYEVFYDNSLDEPINSTDTTYVERRIREDHIVGSSVTIVLCGINTWKRKYVDWEIHSTLLKQHGLLAIWLPTTRGYDYQTLRPFRTTPLPWRLFDNTINHYAPTIEWTTDPNQIKTAIEKAFTNSRTITSNNTRETMQRNK